MSHIFLSYCAEDRERVRPLVALLGEVGPVWWDQSIRHGENWEVAVEKAVEQASCIVVAWTRESVKSDWVRSEAGDARDRRILVPVLLDDVKPPLAFRHLQTAQLQGWNGDPRHPQAQALKAALAGVVAGAETSVVSALPPALRPSEPAASPPILGQGAEPQAAWFRRAGLLTLAGLAAVTIVLVAYLLSRDVDAGVVVPSATPMATSSAAVPSPTVPTHANPEPGPMVPIEAAIKDIPREANEQPAKKPEESSPLDQARAALERGNQLLGEARTGGGNSKAKLTAARAAYMEGLDKLDQARTTEPTRKDAIEETRRATMVTLGGIDAELGHTERALAVLKAALKQKPNDAQVLNMISEVLASAGRAEEAKQYIAQLPGEAKADSNVYLNIGIKAYNDGELDKAFESFDNVVTASPDLADGYYYRGLVWLNRGKKAEARADFETFLKLAPEHRYAADASEFLKNL